MRSLAFRDI
ncbi:hypothetical protein ECEC1737_3660, partial [Escherichia coli EC1737]